MPKKLETTETINHELTDERITSFMIDIANTLTFISYEMLNADGEPVTTRNHTLTGAEMGLTIQRASEIAGADVFAAIKQALYETLPGNGIIE